MNNPSPPMSSAGYRSDIDGLRAVAVLSVVAYHAFPAWMRGGFIGVDIFFVVSGFLITKVIFEDLDRGMFSFSEFYARRVRRIFPSLILVLLSTLVIGWFTLVASEYKQLGKHIAAGAGFVSNLIQWSEAGYFDSSAQTKLLIHLWSLGIEEQFYIVWPIVLWLAWRYKYNPLTLTVLAACVSYTLNLKGIRQDSVSTFYSPQTRFWELLSGSILAWFTVYKKDAIRINTVKIDDWVLRAIYKEPIEATGKTLLNGIAFLGSVLLVYGILIIDKDTNYPGNTAAIPVVATILIILAGPGSWINRTILSNKVAVWFGLVSFPLYLWHWPLLTFVRIAEGDVPSRNIRIATVALSVALAWITYKFVECPIRRSKASKRNLTIFLGIMAIVGYVGMIVSQREGLPFRHLNKRLDSYADSIKVSDRAGECFDIPYAYKKNGDWLCNLGEPSSPVRFFASGDSHALSSIPALENFAIKNKLRIQFTGASGCPSVLGIQSMRGDSIIEQFNCQELNERIFDHISQSGIKSILILNRWTYYTGSMSRPKEFNAIARNMNETIDRSTSTRDLLWAIKNTVSRYASVGVEVIFFEDNPQQIYNPKDILRRGRGIESEYLKLSVSYDEHNKNQRLVNEALRSSGAKVISFDDILCDGHICPLVSNSKFLYSDDDHLSVAGSLAVSKSLSVLLER